MEKSIDSYFTEILGVTYTNPREYSPLSLAYIGDSVFDLLIKTLAVTKDNKQAYKYHKEVSQLVKAEAQAGYIMYLLDNGLLTEEVRVDIQERQEHQDSFNSQECDCGTVPNGNGL